MKWYSCCRECGNTIDIQEIGEGNNVGSFYEDLCEECQDWHSLERMIDAIN